MEKALLPRAVVFLDIVGVKQLKDASSSGLPIQAEPCSGCKALQFCHGLSSELCEA